MTRASIFSDPGARFAASPYGLSLASLAMLVISIAIPPVIYEDYVLEPDLMWSTPFMPAFYVLSVMCFLAGVYTPTFVAQRMPTASRRQGRDDTSYSPETVLWGLTLAIIPNLISAGLIIHQSPGLLRSIMSLQGDLVRGAVGNSDNSVLLSAQAILQATTFWAIFRYFQHRERWTADSRKLVVRTINAAIALLVFISTIKLSRYDLIPTMIELGVVFVYCAPRKQNVGLLKLGLGAALSGAFFIGLFMLVEYIRGNNNESLIIAVMMGYGPASFNHLAAELRQNIMPFPGVGNYTLSFIADLPLIHRFVDIGAITGMQDADTIHRAQFLTTGLSGLNASFIWITCFGYYFADLGNWVYFYVFAIGLYTGLCWRGFESGNTFGMVMYAQAAGSIALWFTYNIFVQASLPIYFEAAIGLYLLERLVEHSNFSRSAPMNAPSGLS